jgi:hypothetical protein
MGLLQALRGQNWQQANAALVDLDGLEAILDNVRDRRARLMPSGGGGNGEITSVK